MNIDVRMVSVFHDHYDEPRIRFYLDENCRREESSLTCADVRCTNMPLTSSCLPQRTNFLIRTLFSVGNKDVLDNCWTALRCTLHAPSPNDPACGNLFTNQKYASIINQTCPEMVFPPTIPVLSDEVYFPYRQNDSNYRNCDEYWKLISLF